jgi:hypothetical protein
MTKWRIAATVGWGSRDARFTHPAHSFVVRVTDVESTMSASRGRDLFMKMDVQEGRIDPFVGTSYSVGGRFYNYDDLVALAEHLSGEPNPVEHLFVSLPDSLSALPGDLSDEIIRLIARGPD